MEIWRLVWRWKISFVLKIARAQRLDAIVFDIFICDFVCIYVMCLSWLIYYINFDGFEAAPKGKSSTLMNIKCQHKTYSHTPFELLIIACVNIHTDTFAACVYVGVSLNVNPNHLNHFDSILVLLHLKHKRNANNYIRFSKNPSIKNNIHVPLLFICQAQKI